MPVDSILVCVAVTSMFAVFAGVMIWANFQTALQESAPPAKHGTS